MPEAHQHVDVVVLEEVERLLSSTSFASIDDLARRLDLSAADDAPLVARSTPMRRPTGVLEPVLVMGEPAVPLPRRH